MLFVSFLAGAKRPALQESWSQGRHGGTENKNEHNSLNFRATDSRFCMEICTLERQLLHNDSTKIQKNV